MSQYRIPEPEDYIQCPYDKVHMVRAKRFPYHLMKCRKNWTGKEYATCPFNARHEMPRPELRYHMSKCESRHVIEQDVYNAPGAEDGIYFKGNTDVPSYSNWSAPESSEDWEGESVRVPRIGITEGTLDNPERFREMVGMTPAEKKKYRQKLKRRAQGLPDLPDEEEDKPSPTTDPTARTPSGLRLPHTAPVVANNSLPQSQPHQNSVFAYSLSMAGFGRGTPISQQQNGGGGEPNRPRMAANFPAANPALTNGYPMAGVKTTAPSMGRGRSTVLNFKNGTTQQPHPGSQATFSMVPPPGFCRGMTVQGVNKQPSPSFVVPMINSDSGDQKTVRDVPDLAHCPPGFRPLAQNGNGNSNNISGLETQLGGGYLSGGARPKEPRPIGVGMALTGHSSTASLHSDNSVISGEIGDANSVNESVSSTSFDTASSQEEEEERKKEVRKIQKKLRQIEDLEVIGKGGKELNSDQLSKISKKQELLDELTNLTLN